MKDLFVKALVVCTAISAFSGGAYTVGSAAKSAFSNAIRSEVTAMDMATQSASDLTNPAVESRANATPSPKAKSKFGITFEN